MYLRSLNVCLRWLFLGNGLRFSLVCGVRMSVFVLTFTPSRNKLEMGGGEKRSRVGRAAIVQGSPLFLPHTPTQRKCDVLWAHPSDQSRAWGPVVLAGQGEGLRDS